MTEVIRAAGVYKADTARPFSHAEARAAGTEWTPADADLVAEVLLIGIENAFDSAALDRILLENNRVIAALETHREIYARVRIAARRRRYYLTGSYDRTQD